MAGIEQGADTIGGVSYSYWAGVFFIFGCIVGSFLNVCIYRLPRGESIINPPSHCPVCNYKIPWYLNIPLVSWVVLRGRCANCSTPISMRYFLVELLTGLMFLAAYLKFGHHSIPLVLVVCLFISALIVASFIDLEHYIIPNEITLGGIIVGFVLSAIVPQIHRVDTARKALIDSGLGIIIGWVLIYIIVQVGKLIFGKQKLKFNSTQKIIFTEDGIWLDQEYLPFEDIFFRETDQIKFTAQRLELPDRGYWETDVVLSPKKLKIGKDEFDPALVLYMEAEIKEIELPREAMGFGDVKFMSAIGAFLGWKGVVFSLCASSIIGAVVGLLLIVSGFRNRSSRIPYGPFIAISAVIWVFFAEEILKMWLG